MFVGRSWCGWLIGSGSSLEWHHNPQDEVEQSASSREQQQQQPDKPHRRNVPSKIVRHPSRDSGDTALAAPLTPLELQLQWRVAYDKDFCGAEALRARRAAGFEVRTTGFTADGSLAPGTPLRLGDEGAGEVLATQFSPGLGTWVGSALLHRRLAHPHVPLTATSDAGVVRVTTRTTPLVYNTSLQIDPHKHSYATRGAMPVPPGMAG